MTRLDWKKDEKTIYSPKTTPVLLTLPAMNYLTINGRGAPASAGFQKAVETLFSLSYGLKFAPRKGLVIDGYSEYAVYPLEGLWDITQEAILRGTWTKDDLIYTLMIRQPEFIKENHIETIKKNLAKKELLLDQVKFETIEEGDIAQILHIGSFDSEPKSFKILDEYVTEKGLERKVKTHKEIYLSDFNKTQAENLKTILRISVKKR
jgi:hypothetical protein